MAVQRFEILLEITPDSRTVLVPYQKGYPIVPMQLEALRLAASARGIVLVEAPAEDADELRGFLEALPDPERNAIDAILIIAEPLGVTPSAFAVLAAFAAPRRIPTGGAIMESDGYRSLFGANPDIVDSGRQAAVQADRVLRGAPAGEVPVVSAENYLEIDYAAARSLGLQVPEGLLARANRILR
jgi:putative ABC transport system substrate-binding protein